MNNTLTNIPLYVEVNSVCLVVMANLCSATLSGKNITLEFNGGQVRIIEHKDFEEAHLSYKRIRSAMGFTD